MSIIYKSLDRKGVWVTNMFLYPLECTKYGAKWGVYA